MNQIGVFTFATGLIKWLKPDGTYLWRWIVFWMWEFALSWIHFNTNFISDSSAD